MLKFISLATIALTTAWFGSTASAQQFRQQPGQQRPGMNNNNQQRNNGNNNNGNDEKPPVKLPEDPRLLELHKGFVIGAEKLATEYEAKGQIDKARSCYEEILRLVPSYTQAADKLAVVKQKEAIAEHRTIDVYANKGWQDAGVNIYTGKPVSLKASGAWTMKMTYNNLPPDGVEIPKELRDFPLGALVGMIATSPTEADAKVFIIGTSTSFTAERDGRLFLRMYDSDPEDNLGKISVYVEGTFKK
jgi:tetratricopeptide (TPR) repeat protein